MQRSCADVNYSYERKSWTNSLLWDLAVLGLLLRQNNFLQISGRYFGLLGTQPAAVTITLEYQVTNWRPGSNVSRWCSTAASSIQGDSKRRSVVVVVSYNNSCRVVFVHKWSNVIDWSSLSSLSSAQGLWACVWFRLWPLRGARVIVVGPSWFACGHRGGRERKWVRAGGSHAAVAPGGAPHPGSRVNIRISRHSLLADFFWLS